MGQLKCCQFLNEISHCYMTVYFFNFNVLVEHCRKRMDLGFLSQKNLSKTGSFARKNTQYYSYNFFYYGKS